MSSTTVHHGRNQSGCYSCLRGVFLSTAELARLLRQRLVSPPSDQPDLGYSGGKSDDGLSDEVQPSDSCIEGKTSVEQPASITAYQENNAMWAPETHVFFCDLIAASVGTASPRGSLSPSGEDTDEEPSSPIRQVRTERIWRKAAQCDHLEKLQEFQVSVELHPCKLSQCISFDRFDKEQMTRARAQRGSVSPSEGNTDEEPHLPIRKVRSDRMLRKTVQCDDSGHLQELQMSFELHPGKLSQWVSFDRFEQEKPARTSQHPRGSSSSSEEDTYEERLPIRRVRSDRILRRRAQCDRLGKHQKSSMSVELHPGNQLQWISFDLFEKEQPARAKGQRERKTTGQRPRASVKHLSERTCSSKPRKVVCDKADGLDLTDCELSQ